MTKFRDGDVVRCHLAGPHMGREGVVRYGTGGGGGFFLVGDSGHWNPDAFHLLRRPVRAGDTLTRSGSDMAITAVRRSGPDDGCAPGWLVRFASGSSGPGHIPDEAIADLGWRHANGTEIDQPKSVAFDGDEAADRLAVLQGLLEARETGTLVIPEGASDDAPIFNPNLGVKGMWVAKDGKPVEPQPTYEGESAFTFTRERRVPETVVFDAVAAGPIKAGQAVVYAKGSARLAGHVVKESDEAGALDVEIGFTSRPVDPALMPAFRPLVEAAAKLARGTLMLGQTDGPRVVIYPDGRVEHDGCEPTDAARIFWVAVGMQRREYEVESLARSLFETDPEVAAFVAARAEQFGWDGRGTYEAFSAARATRYDAAMQRCWDRGDAGESPEWAWWVRATDRAKAQHARLKQ